MMKMPVSVASTADFVDIWDYNLEKEFERIRDLVNDYNYIAMDTEYPGVVARPYGEFRTPTDQQYQGVKANVDILKIIQIGITFFNQYGQTPPGIHTFQFNFKFSLKTDMFAKDSIELLTTAGIQFEEHDKRGIDPVHFSELLVSSGLVLNNVVRWIAFHGSYDFAYLMKLVLGTKLPVDEAAFFELYRLFFPRIYDVKYLMKSVKTLKGGLQDVASTLEIDRVGPQHQAGSDSLLTGHVFFRMREMFFDDKIDDNKYCGFVIGLGNPNTTIAAAAAAAAAAGGGAGDQASAENKL
ncbi:CCR4-NOT transcription complex subunit 7-like [Sycon ciliatum]|uniref:CCR4-NOT transcription complex subunit 7-like n=1 Tax=Sycon ciliatum TaxID=27933 RepID=UPI0020A86EB6|eukprot:scpid66965/ scgid25955/ CCR4-NOT transcription complex subunit 7; CCR4-associated factor 1